VTEAEAEVATGTVRVKAAEAAKRILTSELFPSSV
jgi:hypothetical protein